VFPQIFASQLSFKRISASHFVLAHDLLGPESAFSFFLPLLKSKPTRHNMLSTGLDRWASIIYSNQSGMVITLFVHVMDASSFRFGIA
jgi:hypothetical protein